MDVRLVRSAPSIGEHQAQIPDDLVAALCRRADESAVPLSTVLLTSHAKVLAALSGERDVVAGYGVEAGPPLPLRVTLGPGSWRGALRQVADAETQLLARGDSPVAERDRPPLRTVFETVSGRRSGSAPADGIVLCVALVQHEGVWLRLRYRSDALDQPCAARIAGYHLAVLEMIVADPEADHAAHNLLSFAGTAGAFGGCGPPGTRTRILRIMSSQL